MTLNEFLDEYKVGKSYAYNGTYKGECVSLVKCYIKEVLGAAPQSIGNAKDYWINRNSDYIRSIFAPIANTPAFVPQRGDVFVRTSGKYGHIGIVVEATADYFYTVEQNHNGCRTVKNIKHTDWNDINFLRPKNQKNIISDHKPTIKVGKTYTMQSVRKCYKEANSKKPYKISELSAFNCDAIATRKKGTKVKAIAVNCNWLCYELNGHKVWSCYYDKATDTAQIQ